MMNKADAFLCESNCVFVWETGELVSCEGREKKSHPRDVAICSCAEWLLLASSPSRLKVAERNRRWI